MKNTARLDFFTEQNADYLDLRMIESFPQSARFKLAYGVGATCTVVVFDDYDPHQPATFLCRNYLEDTKEIGSKGRFILAFRIYNSGTLVTVDLVGLKDSQSYAEIAYQHLKKEDWLNVDKCINPNIYHETMISPFLFSNGSFERVSASEIKFVAEEGNYGSQLLLSDAAEVAAFVHTACTRHSCHTRKLPGRNFFFEVGEFISEYKFKPDFYSQFANKFLATGRILNNRYTTAILIMRALERVDSSEDTSKIDLPEAVIQEQRQGIGRYLEKAGGINLIFQDFY